MSQHRFGTCITLHGSDRGSLARRTRNAVVSLGIARNPKPPGGTDAFVSQLRGAGRSCPTSIICRHGSRAMFQAGHVAFRHLLRWETSVEPDVDCGSRRMSSTSKIQTREDLESVPLMHKMSVYLYHFVSCLFKVYGVYDMMLHNIGRTWTIAIQVHLSYQVKGASSRLLRRRFAPGLNLAKAKLFFIHSSAHLRPDQ